jgi:hypothetical protein
MTNLSGGSQLITVCMSTVLDVCGHAMICMAISGFWVLMVLDCVPRNTVLTGA